MDEAFWHRRWQKNEIGFHEGRPNAALETHWPTLALPAGSSVFVPLCGKAVDMAWLAARGYKVLGVELSPIAVRDFFAEHGLEPVVQDRDGFTVSSAGGIEIWCGDLFRLESRHLAGVAAVYDRAALIALPPPMQARYADYVDRAVPKAAPILMIVIDYDQNEMAGPPFSVPPARVHELYAGNFTITTLDQGDALVGSPHFRARGVSRMEEFVLALRRR